MNLRIVKISNSSEGFLLLRKFLKWCFSTFVTNFRFSAQSLLIFWLFPMQFFPQYILKFIRQNSLVNAKTPSVPIRSASFSAPTALRQQSFLVYELRLTSTKFKCCKIKFLDQNAGTHLWKAMLQKCIFLCFAFLKFSKLEMFLQKQDFYIWMKEKNRPGNL